MPMKKSTDTIGNRTRDLPVCSAVHNVTFLPQLLKESSGSALPAEKYLLCKAIMDKC
jgi:hypothetical protein